MTPAERSVLRFRFGTAADVERIVELVQSAYRGEASRAGWTTEAHLIGGQRTDATAVARLIAGLDSLMILATRGEGDIVGCCQLERRDAGVAYFGTFAVQPSEQGTGLGNAILEEAERTARRLWSTTMMEMTVISLRTDLIAWYERRGYHRTGEHRDFPYGDERFGQPRRDDLVFAVLSKAMSALPGDVASEQSPTSP